MSRRGGGGSRRARGVALIVGAVAAYLLTERGPLDFTWVPLLLGASYLLAALTGGERGPLWSPALVLLAFGVGDLLYLGGHLPRGLDEGAVYIVALGIGVLLCAVAERGGFAVSLVGAGAAVLLAGGFFLLQRRFHGLWEESATYAGLLALWGVWELRPGRG